MVSKDDTMKTIYTLMQGLLSALLGYSALVSIYISFIKNKQFDFLTLLFVSTLIALTVFSIMDGAKLPNLSPKQFIRQIIKNKKLLLILIVCFSNLLISFFNISTQYPRGISTPEIGQFGLSLSKNTIEASKRQQQPPLDYYFSAFSHSLFGNNKFAVRFHAMFFYLVLSFILPLGIYFLCSSLWITLMGTLLFSINHVIRLHSVDARPLCLALLTGFFFLFFYISYCNQNKTSRESIKKPLCTIFSSQYLFAISIGLQPIIFILSLFFSSFWLFFLNQKTSFKKLFTTNIATGLLIAPFYINMFFFAKDAYKFKALSTKTLKSYLTNFDFLYFFDKYFLSFYREMSFVFLSISIGLIALTFYKRLETRLLIILSSLILFPLLYDPLFQIGIRWVDLNNWYIIVFSLFLILFVVLSLKEINEYLIPKKWKNYFRLPFLLLFVGSTLLQIQNIKNNTQFHYPYRDNSIEKVYEYLKKRGTQEDIAIELSLVPIAFYRHLDIKERKVLFYDQTTPTILSSPVEYTTTPPFFYEVRGDDIYYIEKWPEQTINKNFNIFFMARKGKDSDKAYNILSNLMKCVTVGEYIVCILTLNSKNKEREYIQFLYKMNKKTPKKYKGALLETLIYYAYKNKNTNEFHRLLQEYKDIELALDEFTEDFKYPSRFELKRRVKYFENLKWD